MYKVRNKSTGKKTRLIVTNLKHENVLIVHLVPAFYILIVIHLVIGTKQMSMDLKKNLAESGWITKDCSFTWLTNDSPFLRHISAETCAANTTQRRGFSASWMWSKLFCNRQTNRQPDRQTP